MKKNLVYMDHNSTTYMIDEVRDFLMCFDFPMNPSSIHSFGREAKNLLEDARAKLYKLLNINPKAYDIIFTSSGTESNNMVMNSFKDRDVIISEVEHQSIYDHAKNNARIYVVKVDEDGQVDLDHLNSLLANFNSGGLISVIFANNETGVITDLKSISKIAKDNGVYIHSDCAQAIGKIKCDFSDLGIDIATISSHKIGGPMGASAVIAKKGLLSPMIIGGGQEFGYRSGTENIPAILGFVKAIEISLSRIDGYTQKTSNLRDAIELRLDGKAIIAAQKTNRLPNTSMLMMPNLESHTQMMIFDNFGFMVSNGSACSSGRVSESRVLKSMGYDKLSRNCIRVSLGISNTEDEINDFCDKWEEIFDKHN